MTWLIPMVLMAASHVSAIAATYQLSPVADTTIFAEQNGNSDYDSTSDGGPNLWVATTFGSQMRRALLRFDLSAIAPGSRITSVQLSLYEIRARDNGNVALHRVLASWGEATSSAGDSGSGAPAEAGDATWAYRYFPSVTWSVRGGDISPQPSATIFVGSPGERYTWSSTQMMADVQGWLNAPATNHGWIMIGDEAREGSAKRFGSRENSVASLRPILTVHAEPPVADASGDVPLPFWAPLLLGSVLLACSTARSRR